MNINQNSIVEKAYPWILSVGGLLGLIAMTWQAAERVHMLKYPTSALSCNLNPVVDCSGVLNNHLAAIFGFPNAFLGMIFFAILATNGLLLLAGGKFVGWYRHFVMDVSTILLLFSIWFFGVSLYIIGKLCIFCIVGWIVSIPIFWYGLLFYLRSSGNKNEHRKLSAVSIFGDNHHLDVVIVTYVIMLVLFLFRFRDYYFS